MPYATDIVAVGVPGNFYLALYFDDHTYTALSAHAIGLTIYTQRRFWMQTAKLIIGQSHSAHVSSL